MATIQEEIRVTKRPMTCVEFHTGQTATEKEKQHESGKTEEMHVYDCPFCGKEQHLFFFPSNTIWDCKACGKKGNVHVFNQHIYNDVAKAESKDLAETLTLPRRVFAEVRYNPLNGTYLFPTFRNDKLNNLYKYVEELNRFMGTPGLPATLQHWSDDAHDEVWLVEGQKDRLAADALIGLGHEVTPIAIPGANMFRDSWVGAFAGKDVVLCFDNDDAGRSGKDKTLAVFRKCHNKPKSIKEIVWPEDFPEGGDLRDFYNEHRGRSWAEVQRLIHAVQDEEATKVVTENILEDFTCDSYDKALEVYSTAYHLTPDMTAALAMVMASIYSINIEGEQLWLKIIGSPGCGKTRIAKAVSASDSVVNMSTFTGLFSGWKDADEKDSGLIPTIANRTLIVKDADALLRQPNIEKIMSELRDFYDKDSDVAYRNRVRYNYRNIRSTFIMLGTQVLRRSDQSFLGERLLTLEMDVSEPDKELISNKMMQRSIEVALGQTADPEVQIMSSMKGWINHLQERPLDSTIPVTYQKQLMQLCTLTSLMRTQVDRDMRGKLLSPALPELPTRLIGQTVTATLALCAVFGENLPTEQIYQYVKKTLRDTINPRSHRFLICDTILETPKITGVGLMEATNLEKSVVGAEIRDLLELGFVSPVDVPGPTPMHKGKGFVLAPKLVSSFTEITNG